MINLKDVYDIKYEYELALILPIYNEGEVLIENIRKLEDYLDAYDINYLIICVDDCSEPKTKDVLCEIANGNPRVCLYENSSNQGKGKSVKAGIEIANSKYVIFTDSDLAYTLQSIHNVYLRLKENNEDIVFANRRHKDTKFIIDYTMFSYVYSRHRISGIFNFIVNSMFKINIADTQSGLKGFTNQSAHIIFDELSVYNFAFDVELFILAKKHNYNCFGIPCVIRYPHEVSTVRLVADSFDMLLTLVKLWMKHKKMFKLESVALK